MHARMQAHTDEAAGCSVGQPETAHYTGVFKSRTPQQAEVSPPHWCDPAQGCVLLTLLLSDSSSAEAMNTGICVCVLLAALSSSGCLALSTHSFDEGQPDSAVVATRTRHTRALPPSGQLNLLSKPQDEELEEDPGRRLNELLLRLISRKGSYRRSPVNSRSPSHRIKDRDYLGWMDFGRRSAEEYEYSS